MPHPAASPTQVARALGAPVDDIRPAVLDVPLRVRTRNEVTLLMNEISFSPGTVALELYDHHLYVHALSTGDPTSVLAEIITMEDRIMAALEVPQLDTSGIT